MHTTSHTYEPLFQQVKTVTDPLGHTTTFEYDGADLVKVTDALNRVVQRFTDAVGRVVGIADPLGNVTRLDYDAFDRLLKQTDALGKRAMLRCYYGIFRRVPLS